MKKSKIIIISILTSILLLGGIFVFAYFTFFYNVKGSEIVLENVKFQVNDSPNKGEEDVVYFTTDDLTQGDGYQINLNYSLNGNFVSNYAMKYKTFFEVTDTNNISTAIDVYRFYDDNYHYVDKLSNLIYDESDENGSSIYTDFLGVTGTHCEKFLLVYSMGSTIEDKNSFNLKISTKSEMVTTTSAEFPYFYLNDMGSSGDDNSNAETAESILKQLPSNDLIYGRTIVLMRDITYTKPTNITFENLVGIDLNGHKLNLAGGSLVFKDTNESESVNYNNKIGIYDSVGIGSFDNTNVSINYTKSVIDIDSVFYNNSDAKLINGSTFTISKISMDAFGSAAKEKFAYITQSKHTVNNGSYTFDLFGNLKYYLLSNSLSMDTNNIAVSSARGEAGATLNSDKTITVSNITNSDSISLTLTASGFDTQAQINDILQLYGSTTDSCKEYLESYIPKKLDGSIYLPSYISTFNSYITWISYDENLINKNGMVLPNGYFNLDNWVSQRTNLGFIIDQSGEQMSGVIKDIEITVLTVEERVELLFDPISVTFNNDDSTTYNFDVIEMLYKKYDSTNLAEIASTYFNITIDTTLSDEAQREAFIIALTNKIGLETITISANQESDYVSEKTSTSSDLMKGVLEVTQNGVPNDVVSLIYSVAYKFIDSNSSLIKNKLININTGESEVTLVDLTNSLRVPFDVYTEYMTSYEEMTNNYRKYNTYLNQFELVSSFSGKSIDYVVPSIYSDYVKLVSEGNHKYIQIIRDKVPADTHTVTITARVDDVSSPIYLPFTCVGVLHNVTSKEHAEFENGNLYIELLNRYDINKDNVLTDLEAVNSPNTQLTISKTKLESLVGLRYFTNLKTLDFSDCQIVNINDLSYLNGLTSVNLPKNKIASVEAFKYLDNLEQLVLNENQISSIEPIRYLTGLKRLNISSNAISDFKYVEDLIGLTELRVFGNKISGSQYTVSLENATSSGDYNYLIRSNQYYFNILGQKIDALGGTLKLYVANNGSQYSYGSTTKSAAEILSKIEPISITSDTITLPTYINISGTKYEITYNTTNNYENYINITRNDETFHVTNINLNQIPVNNAVTIYARVLGLAEHDTELFYRPFEFIVRKGFSNATYYGQIEVTSGNWVDAQVLVPDEQLISSLWTIYDANKDGKITNTELKHTGGAVTVNLDSKGVKSIDGIQYFGNIQTLNLRNNTLNLNELGNADIRLISYLNNLKNLYLNGQKFNFDDLIYFTRLKDGSTFTTYTSDSFTLKNVNNVEFTVDFSHVGLTTLVNLYLAGSLNLSEYDTKTKLYHVYLNNTSINIYKDDNSTKWNPLTEEVNKFLGSMTTTANFINYNDQLKIKKSYNFYMYDDLYPTTFTLSSGSISDDQYVFSGGSTGHNPTTDNRYKSIYLKDDTQYELSPVDTGFINKENHKLKSYFNIDSSNADYFKITYQKLIYKDYQAYLNMTLKTTSISNGRKTVDISSTYYLTLFMQYNNDYTFLDDMNIDVSQNGDPINKVFGSIEAMMLIMNGISEELRLGTRGYNYSVTDIDGTVTTHVSGIPNYVVKSSEIDDFDGSFNGSTSCDFDLYFFIHGNFMPTAKSAVDGLRFLTQIKKAYFRRDAVLGTGKDLINLEEIFMVYTYFDIKDFDTVLPEMKYITLAQSPGTNISDELNTDSNPNNLVETYMVYFPNVIQFHFCGEGLGEKGQMYEWSAFLAYSYIPYNQIFEKYSDNTYRYYHLDGSIEYVGGVRLDSDKKYYWYDDTNTDYNNFKNVYYLSGSNYLALTQDAIDSNPSLLVVSGNYYANLYIDALSGNKLNSSCQLFRHVEEETVYLNNFKLSRGANAVDSGSNKYSNTYVHQVVLMELYKNLEEGSITHFYIGHSTTIGNGNSYDFDPAFSLVTYETDVTKEYNELAPSIADLHVKLTGNTFDGTTLNDTEYSSLSWTDTDYTDYFRKGLVVKLPVYFSDYKTGYPEYDSKYRNFTIKWYASYAIDSTSQGSDDYVPVVINTMTDYVSSARPFANNVFTNASFNNNTVQFTLNYSGYYLFEGLLELSDGTNSYAFNTNYVCKSSSTVGEDSYTYSYDISGSVSIIYPIVISSMNESQINSLSNSYKKSIIKVANNYISIDYANNSMTNTTYNLKWYDTIIDRSFKFVVFLTYGKDRKAQSAVDFTLDLSYESDNIWNNDSSSRMKLMDKIINKIYGQWTHTDISLTSSNINTGIDINSISDIKIRTYYGLSRFLSDIYTLEGWETLNIKTFKYKYASNITFLPDRFPYRLETLWMSSTYGITYYGGLFDSNVVDAKLSYFSSETGDAGVVQNGNQFAYYSYQNDNIFDIKDCAELVNKIEDESITEIDLKLTSLALNAITEDSFKLLADLSKKLKEKITIYMVPGYADNFTLQFRDYNIVKYFVENMEVSKMEILVGSQGINLYNTLSTLKTDYDKVENPNGIWTSSNWYSKTSNLSSNVTVKVFNENYKFYYQSQNGENDTVDFYPNTNLGKFNYKLAIRYTNGNSRIQIFKEINAQSAEDDSCHELKIAVFKDTGNSSSGYNATAIRTGQNSLSSANSYSISDFWIYDTSKFDKNFVNYLSWLLKNPATANSNSADISDKGYVTSTTVNGYTENIARGLQTLDKAKSLIAMNYQLNKDNYFDYLYYEGWQYILDTHLLLEGYNGDVDGDGNNDTINAKTYLIIINTEFLHFEYYSSGNYTGPKNEQYTTLDVKGFELLPYRSITQSNGSKGHPSNMYFNKIINSSNITEGYSPKLEYIEINNSFNMHNYNQNYNEPDFAMYTYIYDFSNLTKSLIDGATLVFGNRVKLLQRYLQYDETNGLTLVNDQNKNIHVILNYSKMHLLFYNGNYDTSFTYQMLKQEILNATVGNDTIFLKNYNDYYTPNYYKLINFAGGELTNITMYNNIQNHPFYSSRNGVLADDSVYNYYISDNEGPISGGRIIYSSELYDTNRLIGLLLNVHSNNIRTTSKNDTMSMYDVNMDANNPINIDSEKLYTLSSDNSLIFPKKYNGVNVIYLPVDTYYSSREFMYYYSTSGRKNKKEFSFLPISYFDQLETNYSISGHVTSFDIFVIKEYKDYYEIGLKETYTSYTALRYKFYAFEYNGTQYSDSNYREISVSDGYKTYAKFIKNYLNYYDGSFNVDKAKKYAIGEFYVDINGNKTLGRQTIKNDEPLYLPKYLNVLSKQYEITYTVDTNYDEYIEIVDMGDYYKFELTNSAVNSSNIEIVATIETDRMVNTFTKFTETTYSINDLKWQYGAYKKTSSKTSYYSISGNKIQYYYPVTLPTIGTKYYYVDEITSLNEIINTYFYVDIAAGERMVPNTDIATVSADFYVQVLVNNETGEVVPGTLVSEYENQSGFEYRIIKADTIFESGLLLTDMYYSGAISLGSSAYTRHDQISDGVNVDFFPKYVVLNSSNQFVLESNELITFDRNDESSANSYIVDNPTYHLAFIYTKEQIANIHYFSCTTLNASDAVDFRAQSILNGLEIFPLTHVRLGYYNENNMYDGVSSNCRAFPGNTFTCFKDMKLVEFALIFKHTSIFVSDWTFLFNSRDTLTKFMYGGLLVEYLDKNYQRAYQVETYPTTHDDFSFLLSFDNLTDIRLYGLAGIEYTQSFRYFVSTMYIKHNGNIVHYYKNGSEYNEIYSSIPSDVNNASVILQEFKSQDLSDFTYQNGFELYIGDNSSYYSNISNYDGTALTQYLLPSYINDGGTYYKLTYESLSNFMDVVAIDISNSTEHTMLQYQALYANYVHECLEANVEVNDKEFADKYKIYVRFKNLANCLTDRIMISAKIECLSKMVSKDSILDIDNSLDALKTAYININGNPKYYDGNQYIYTPYTYQRFLSIYVDHTAII